MTEEVQSPVWKSEDFSLIKNFPITEMVKFQLKVEALDAFNRHNFSIPSARIIRRLVRSALMSVFAGVNGVSPVFRLSR